MLKAMIDVLQRHRLAIPTSLTLLSRAILTLDGTLHIVAPSYPLADRAAEIARPFLVPFEPTEQSVQRELLRTLPALRNLPSHAEAIAAQVRSGQLTLRTRSFADPGDAAFLRSLVNRALLAAVGLVGILTAAIILLASSTSSNQGDARVLEGIGYAGLFLGSVITMRVVALIVRDRSA
jgi:ubiquinone biosynthesis protein